MKEVLIMNHESRKYDNMIRNSSLKPMCNLVYHEFKNNPIA